MGEKRPNKKHPVVTWVAKPSCNLLSSVFRHGFSAGSMLGWQSCAQGKKGAATRRQCRRLFAPFIRAPLRLPRSWWKIWHPPPPGKPTSSVQPCLLCICHKKNLNSTPKLIFHFNRMLLNSKQLCPGLLGTQQQLAYWKVAPPSDIPWTWWHRILWLLRVTNQYFHWAASQCRSSKQNNLSNFSCKDFAKSSVSSDLTRPYYLRGL